MKEVRVQERLQPRMASSRLITGCKRDKAIIWTIRPKT